MPSPSSSMPRPGMRMPTQHGVREYSSAYSPCEYGENKDRSDQVRHGSMGENSPSMSIYVWWGDVVALAWWKASLQRFGWADLDARVMRGAWGIEAPIYRLFERRLWRW